MNRGEGTEQLEGSLEIEIETRRFVEIEDIREELGIMQMVLEDQRNVLKDMDKALRNMSGTNQAPLCSRGPPAAD